MKTKKNAKKNKKKQTQKKHKKSDPITFPIRNIGLLSSNLLETCSKNPILFYIVKWSDLLVMCYPTQMPFIFVIFFSDIQGSVFDLPKERVSKKGCTRIILDKIQYFQYYFQPLHMLVQAVVTLQTTTMTIDDIIFV